MSEAFWTELQASFPASTCDDLPPPIDFANGLIGTEMTRVPEPGGETAGMAAALALGGLARWRTRRAR